MKLRKVNQPYFRMNGAVQGTLLISGYRFFLRYNHNRCLVQFS